MRGCCGCRWRGVWERFEGYIRNVNMLASVIADNLEGIADLCRKYNVRQLEVFGSAATGKYTDKSDVDFLVEFPEYDIENPPSDYLDNYFLLLSGLEDLTGRQVGIVTKRFIKNPIFKRII